MEDEDLLDSNGKPPKFSPGDRVYVRPLKEQATVIKQFLCYDMGESFWGNLHLKYDDGTTGVSNSWQVTKVE